ncbi:MAG: hypothetical protein KAQ97_09005 [Candidatus Fermentibacteraceae bacterium]|nr:hypothetical protein [Candidatus Fermentibacteraceae bacterium]
MKKTILLLAAIGLVLSVSAGSIRIVNNTGGYDIWYVFISSTYDDSWGDDWLDSDEAISSGSSVTFNVSNDIYDIRLVDEDDDEYIRYGVDVSGTYVWNVTLDDLGEVDLSAGSYSGEETVYGDVPVTIYNDTGGYDIYWIYANPSSYSEWGDDRLGSEILYSGDEFTFWVDGNDYYDIKCEDEDGDTYTFWEMWVGADGLYLPVDLGDLD